VKKELRGTVRVGSYDHLLGGIRVTLEMRRSLCPTGMPGMHLVPASLERDELIHLVQLMDLDAELFRQGPYFFQIVWIVPGIGLEYRIPLAVHTTVVKEVAD